MLRILIVFACLTALLWVADRIDTPDTVSAIKPLFWSCALLLAGLSVRAMVELARSARASRARGATGDTQ